MGRDKEYICLLYVYVYYWSWSESPTKIYGEKWDISDNFAMTPRQLGQVVRRENLDQKISI